MDEKTTAELTLDTFAEQYPELHNQLVEKARQEGGKSVRELFGKFVEKFGDDPAFCIEHFSKGDLLEQAVEAKLEKLKAEYRGSAKLQAEFGGPAGLKDYIAYRKAKDAGKT